ncbi:MAG: ribonuclease R, partial [Anaerovoracaceae bacterium]
MKKKIKKKKKSIRISGILQKHRKGFGFVSVEDGGADIFISREGINGAMNGDMVVVDLLPECLCRGDSREGIITAVETRAIKEVVGTFDKSKRFGFVVPDDKKLNDDIFINKKYFSGAQKGDKVVAEIIKYPDKNNSAEGKITQVISRYGEPGGDIKALIRQYNLFETFPSKAAAEAKAVSKLGIREEELAGRLDLRDKMTITIDGADSKDFDDAVSCERLPGGNYLLGVHIADVTHYVANNGPLDKEAMKRGNSVYLIDQVIPMLPFNLSNGVCSLNPGEDRLTLSCIMEIDQTGEVVSHELAESIIHSKERMVYGDVSDMIEDKDQELKERYSHVYPDILCMAQLAELLAKRRTTRGSLDFDLDEAHITLNEEGIPINIGIAERRVANKLIEEFMLLANTVVAEHFFHLEAPFVYRVHEIPAKEKMEEFAIFLKGFGIALKGKTDSVHPKTLNDILDKVSGQTYENVVNTVMLRSMQKAIYSTECKGHFGLALAYYCHFTSPIRRYPDLMIHRIIKGYLHGKIDGKALKSYGKKAEEVATISGDTERQAIELERQVEKMKKAEYMS